MTDGTPAVDRPVRRVSRRGVLQAAGVTAASLVGAQALTERVMAQSGGPDNEISGTVTDANGAVENATVVAVPHDISLSALATTTDANGDYIFQESDLHNGENLYHVITRDGSETSPRRGQENYPFIAAQGVVAIPDSAIHRWILDDVDTGTATDSIGNANGSVSGVSSVSSSNYQGGAAGDGNGTSDVITTGTLGTFGSNSASDWAMAFTVDNFDEDADATSGYPMGISSTGASGNMQCHIRLSQLSKGDVALQQRDSGGNLNRWVTDSGGHVDGNNLVRVLVNKVATTGANAFEVYVAGSGDTSYTSVSASEVTDGGFGNASLEDFTTDWALFAENAGSGGRRHANAVLDDIIIYDSSLTSSERATDLGLQPAFG